MGLFQTEQFGDLAGRDASEAIAAMQEVAARVRRSGRSSADVEAELDRGARDAPEPARSDRRRRGHGPARGGRAGRFRPRPPRARRRADRHGGRRAGLRLALRLSEGRPRAARARARALGVEVLRGHGFAPVSRRCSCARRRCTAPASCPTPSSRSTGWRTTSCTSWARARCRWRRCTRARSSRRARCRCATRASRPASGARRARPAATRAGSSASTSSTRSRCSAFVEPDESGAEHERLLAIEEEMLQALDIPYRVVNIAVDDLGASAAKKYDLEAWMPAQRRLRRGHLDVEHDRLPGPAAGHPLPPGRPAARAHAQRHGGHVAAHDRAAREPRTTAVACPRCCSSGVRPPSCG